MPGKRDHHNPITLSTRNSQRLISIEYTMKKRVIDEDQDQERIEIKSKVEEMFANEFK